MDKHQLLCSLYAAACPATAATACLRFAVINLPPVTPFPFAVPVLMAGMHALGLAGVVFRSWQCPSRTWLGMFGKAHCLS